MIEEPIECSCSCHGHFGGEHIVEHIVACCCPHRIKNWRKCMQCNAPAIEEAA